MMSEKKIYQRTLYSSLGLILLPFVGYTLLAFGNFRVNITTALVLLIVAVVRREWIRTVALVALAYVIIFPWDIAMVIGLSTAGLIRIPPVVDTIRATRAVLKKLRQQPSSKDNETEAETNNDESVQEDQGRSEQDT